ncbi:MAG: T9SS type A sorting domain-containing protein [Bacteroidetes bacterium]|nr:T9SS type A sorting domain-containing protein [Bacteroidota bacterium]
MKNISILLSFLLVILGYNSQAQTTYTVSSNTSWNSTYGSSCSNCIFNISSGVTLAIDRSVTCNTCTFNGGKIDMTDNVNCQPCTFSGNTITIKDKVLKPNSGTTSFSNVNFTANGDGSILANTAVTITSSTFTFNSTTFFKNNGGQLDVTSSILTFNDDTYFLATAGPVNLKTSSKLIAGNGTVSSTAYIKMNGPTLNVYDASLISIKNKNNSYFNWGSYNAATTGSSYSTTSFTATCGGSGQHACSTPNVYGCATLNAAGASACSLLPVSINDFTAEYISNHVELVWSTSEEINFDHFSIERSTDGANWQSIGIVYSKYSSTGNTYDFSDGAYLDNTAYYRLQIVDKDGRTSYTKIISIDAGTTASLVSIYPNPVTNLTFNIKLSSADATVVNVFTMDGRLLFMTSFDGQTQYQVKLPQSASASTYLIVQVISKGQANTFNIINRK